MDGMAMAEPMMVCGRVKRHITRGKGGGGGVDDDFLSTATAPTTWAEELSSSFLWTLSSMSMGKLSSPPPSAPMDMAATRGR